MYNFDIYNVITKVRTVAIYVLYANVKKKNSLVSHICASIYLKIMFMYG